MPVLAERRTTLLITTPGAAASVASDALRTRRGLGSSEAAAPEGWVCAGWVGPTAPPALMLGDVLSASVPVAFGFVISRRLKEVHGGMLGHPNGLEAAQAEGWAP